ncbi:phospholipid-transporting ATPase VD-like [Corticium candelabrum]|uniref:phospholipid-transporting ATPase VD-like n=1 Tax=Corticium candelabrum TaxID=121492 RepID=UPI002E25A667|nr:phospholipid-transporting ATPase VD-like [Corticium candelabrum]
MHVEEDIERLVRPNVTPVSEQETSQYPYNRIRTAKYTILTFLPKNLFEQFHRVTNCYFLAIIGLNFIPDLNVFGKELGMLPLLFILSVTAAKDIFEDRRRYLLDKEVNHRRCLVYSSSLKQFVQKAWQDVKVGDMVKLDRDAIVPADLLLLWSSEKDNTCYVETANLDGESNLKQRHCPKGFRNQGDQFDPGAVDLEICCGEPDNKIYHFNGKGILTNGSTVALDSSNLLLRSCVLRNTKSVVGLVLYAGHDTKSMRNNSGTPYKRSKLERMMNTDILWCIVILLVLCLTGAIGDTIWLTTHDYKNVIYLGWTDADRSAIYDGFLRFWSFIIVLQIIIPISLYVSVEIVKLAQVFFMQLDVKMYHQESDTPLCCRALNISEDLGQTEYLFSDKTGTLTENKMVFRKCSIVGAVYGHSGSISDGDEQSEDVQEKETPITSKSESEKILIDNLLQEQLCESQDATDSPLILSEEQEFMVILATCNTVAVGHTSSENQASNVDCDFTDSGNTEGEEIVYEAENPDEAALVNAAKAYGVTLQSRTLDSLTVDLLGFGCRKYQLLHVLSFTSERKRMSVILQNSLTQEIVLYCKGADSVIYNLLKREAFYPPSIDRSSARMPRQESTEALAEVTQRHLDGFARLGLRTLCIAKRVIKQQEYSVWLKQREAAEQALSNREVLLDKSASAIEHSLELIGATGIEDRLQDGVPETISALRDAGLVVWVLTGDKQETAISVAFASQLFNTGMEIMRLNATTKDDCQELLKIRRKELKSHLFHLSDVTMPNGVGENIVGSNNTSCNTRQPLRTGLVIDGQTLEFALDDDLKDDFLELAKACHSVVCCRSTPIQKAAVVELVKEKEHVVCMAVGDGANDVSMIQMAHVGVGIAGNEGLQAVMASDFSIARFKFLRRLLLVHGHWSYDRLANMVLYFFYKNAVYVFLLFWYQIYCGWSSVVPVEQFSLVLYNLVFTSLPPMVVGAVDQDISDDMLLRYPSLYSQGRKSKTYSRFLFALNILDSLWQSLVMFFVSLLAYYGSNVGRLEFGTTQNTACVLTVLLHLAVEMHYWTWVHHFTMWGSMVVYFAWALFYNGLFQYPGPDNVYWVMEHTIATGNFWFCVILTPAIALTPRILANTIKRLFFPTLVQQAEQAVGYLSGEPVTTRLSTNPDGIASVIPLSDDPAHIQHEDSRV